MNYFKYIVMEKQQKALIGGVVLMVLHFSLLPVVTGSAGWNDDATYATLYKVLVPIGIALSTALTALKMDK